MADIKYTPSELLAQSAELNSLQSEYDALFVKTTNALNGLNESWSENLSRNFSGKIQSAQKSFSSILNMLTNGSAAAKLAATSHSPTSIETFLSSIGIADKQSVGSSVSAGQYTTILTDAEKKQIYEKLPDEVKATIGGAQNVDKWLAKNYDTLPEGVRKGIEDQLPSGLKDTISIAREVVSGEADFSTVGKAATMVFNDTSTGRAVTSTLEATYNSNLEQFTQASDEAAEKAYNSFSSGDIGGGILYTAEAFGHETRKAVYALGDAYTNYIGNWMGSSKYRIISRIGSAIHDLM